MTRLLAACVGVLVLAGTAPGERAQPMVVAAVWRHFSPTFVETCHEAGAIVIVDEQNRDSWPEALAWGAGGIQTDYPEELIAYLRAQEAGAGKE